MESLLELDPENLGLASPQAGHFSKEMLYELQQIAHDIFEVSFLNIELRLPAPAFVLVRGAAAGVAAGAAPKENVGLLAEASSFLAGTAGAATPNENVGLGFSSTFLAATPLNFGLGALQAGQHSKLIS